MRENPRDDGSKDAEYLPLQDASREFGLYPSTIRAWQRAGLISPEHVTNGGVQRGALLRAIEAAKGSPDPKEPVVPPDLTEIDLARRILDICKSDSDLAAKMRVIESVAQSVLDRMP